MSIIHVEEVGKFSIAKKGIFYDFADQGTYSQLGNSLAILCAVATNEEARIFCEHIIRDLDVSLIYMSMCCYKYDALLKIDENRYKETVLSDIEEIYKPMIDFDSTTVWETENGKKISQVQEVFATVGAHCRFIIIMFIV